MDRYLLTDNERLKQYEFHIGEHVPKIEYIKTAGGIIYLTHTEVPPQLEGRGIGARLVAAVLADIERQGLQLVPMCSFVSSYIRRNPEWNRIVVHKTEA
ncbi:GNAT family N-acetyltransferase [uncultured Alistipes sp.]|uniref:GNAT family N-acetyltransferase n=1 Tax=uncultured Alistipes sp. TaxID=538949 RepID=UPI0026308D4C|nr:GNAT family N-acetyltransferase [uncultured Alistipes sp.]